MLDLMKMDMANFTIQQIRPYLQQQSVEYERKKFNEFLKTQQGEHACTGLLCRTCFTICIERVVSQPHLPNTGDGWCFRNVHGDFSCLLKGRNFALKLMKGFS